MTTSLTYSTVGLWFTTYSSASLYSNQNLPVQSEITTFISNGDADIELRTGATASSTMRDLLIKEYTLAATREYIKHKATDGAENIQVTQGSVAYIPSENFFKKYYEMCERYNKPDYNHLSAIVTTLDYSNVEW